LQISAEKVLQWEESKKWQKKVDSLKTRLSDSNKEVESLQKQIRSLKETLERYDVYYIQHMILHVVIHRSDREKSYLHKKLQTVQKYPSSRLRTPTTLTNTDDVQSMNQVEELKRQIHQLEEEVCSKTNCSGHVSMPKMYGRTSCLGRGHTYTILRVLNNYMSAM